MLEESLPLIGVLVATVLTMKNKNKNLARDPWSMVKLLRRPTNEYPHPLSPVPLSYGTWVQPYKPSSFRSGYRTGPKKTKQIAPREPRITSYRVSYQGI